MLMIPIIKIAKLLDCITVDLLDKKLKDLNVEKQKKYKNLSSLHLNIMMVVLNCYRYKLNTNLVYISKILGYSLASISKNIKLLESKNLIIKNRNKNNEREIFISLTAEGLFITELVEDIYYEFEADIISKLDEKEIKNFSSILFKILSLLWLDNTNKSESERFSEIYIKKYSKIKKKSAFKDKDKIKIIIKDNINSLKKEFIDEVKKK